MVATRVVVLETERAPVGPERPLSDPPRRGGAHRRLLIAAVVLVVAALVVALARAGDDEAPVAAGGRPTGMGALDGRWLVTGFDPGDGAAVRVTWDPTRPVWLDVHPMPSWGDAHGGPEVTFTEDGCGTSLLGLTITSTSELVIHAETYRTITGPCPDPHRYELPPLRALLTSSEGRFRYRVDGGRLRLEAAEGGAWVAAAREDDLDEPLPPHVQTPDELFGGWELTSWTDGDGTHDVVPPPGYTATLGVHEGRDGPWLGYSVDFCNGSGHPVTYDGDRIVTDPTRHQASSAMGCAHGRSLPALGELFAGEPVRYEVEGDDLLLRNEERGITFRARRAG